MESWTMFRGEQFMDGTRRCVVGAWVEDTPLWRKVSVDGGVEPSFGDWQ